MTNRFFKTAFLLSALATAVMPATELRAQDSKANALIDEVTRGTRMKLIQARLANFEGMDDALALKIMDLILAEGGDLKLFLVDDAYAAKLVTYNREMKEYIALYLSGKMEPWQYKQINDLLIQLYPNTFNMLPGLAS